MSIISPFTLGKIEGTIMLVVLGVIVALICRKAGIRNLRDLFNMVCKESKVEAK